MIYCTDFLNDIYDVNYSFKKITLPLNSEKGLGPKRCK